MNPRILSQSQVVRAVSLIAFAGCGSGSVGSDCASTEECTALSLSKSDGEEPSMPESESARVDVQPLAELTLDWVKRLPGPATLVNGSHNRVLRSDKLGPLVFFNSDQRRSVHVARIDSAGEMVQPALEVPAPDGWNGGDETIASIAEICSGVCTHDGSASISVGWATETFKDDVSWTQQQLLFSEDLSAAPERRDVGQRGEISNLVRDSNGDLYEFHADPEHHVTKLDGDTGRALWEQGGFLRGAVVSVAKRGRSFRRPAER